MNLIEQHRRHAGQFGIGLDAIDENALGDDGDARLGRALAVHPRGIAVSFADALARQRGHPLRRGACGKAPGAEQQDFVRAPRLVEQRRRDGSGLARAGRRDQHRIGAIAQRRA